jgi:hypothetical protein
VTGYGSALREAAATVTKELGGTNPWLQT